MRYFCAFILRFAAGVLCFFPAALLTTAWAGDMTPKTLVYSWHGNVGPLNPHLYSPNQMFAQAMVYEPLVRYGDNGQIIPCLAESWEMSADGLRWLFHLRRGVVFSDGTPFNARAVKMNMDTVILNRDQHSWLGVISLMTEIRITDDYTIQITLKNPYSPILYELTLVRPFRFLSPAAFPESGNTADGIKSAVGTGCWKLVKTRLGEYDIFERNERYWGAKPDIAKIVVRVISDPNTRAVAFETGEIDLIYGDDQISPDTFKRFQSDPRYTARISQPIATRALAVNSGRMPTSDPAVRRAIQHAVNKDSIVKGIFLGTETRADTLLSGKLPYCDLGLAPYHYDPVMSENILDKAGWKKTDRDRFRSKDGVPLAVDICFIGKSAIEKSVSEVLQADLQKVGIRTKLNGVEEDMFGRKQKEGDFHLIFNDTWGAPYEPHSYCSSMRIPSHADYQAQTGLPMKAEIDRKISMALISMDEKERQESYRYVLSTLYEQAIYLPISFSTGYVVHGSKLSGVFYGPTNYEIPFEKMIRN